MEKLTNQLWSFLDTRAGRVVLFLIVFYALTFVVYSLYSPGPEERRRAQDKGQEMVDIASRVPVTKEIIPGN